MTTFKDTSTAETMAAAMAVAQSPNGQLAIVRMLMGRASELLALGTSKSDVICAFSGNLELYDFIVVSGDFYNELGRAMDMGARAVDALADCLFVNGNQEIAFKPEGDKRIVVTTQGGTTLLARVADIAVDAAGRLSGVWDMRHQLIRDPRHFATVAPGTIKAIEYVR